MNFLIPSWLVCASLSTLLLFIWKSFGIHDIPSHRSSHSKAVPTAAGICISLVFLSFFLSTQIGFIPFEKLSYAFVAGFIILTAVGFIDDWKELHYKTRLLSHALAVGLVLTQQPLGPIEYMLWFFIGVGLVNACNFMDGLNGLLAGQWLLTVGFLLSAFAPMNSLFWILWIATLVYLFFNFPKAHVFIGDTGSTILGFSYFALIFTLAFNQQRFPSFFIPHDSFIIFSLFPLGFAWGDIVFTLARRFLQKRSVTASFNDYGFHYKARFFKSHSLVTLFYLILNCLLIFGVTCLLSHPQYIFLICCLYVVAQIFHWMFVYRLSKKYK